MTAPQITTCILCDGVRLELGNKLIIFGYYGLVPGVEIQIPDFNLPILICFVFVGGPADGHFRAELRVIPEHGLALFAVPVEGDFAAGRKETRFIMTFQDKVPGPGPYNAELLLNGTVAHRSRFLLTPITPPPAPTIH